MRSSYLDASALAKRYAPEAGTPTVRLAAHVGWTCLSAALMLAFLHPR